MRHLAFFMLFVYENYIYEDFDYLTKMGKIFIIPAWYVKSFFTWILMFIFFPIVLTDIYFKTNKKWLQFKEKIDKRVLELLKEIP